MGDDLKPCPFCPDGGMPYKAAMNTVACRRCSAEAFLGTWNSRPCEDRARAEGRIFAFITAARNAPPFMREWLLALVAEEQEALKGATDATP